MIRLIGAGEARSLSLVEAQLHTMIEFGYVSENIGFRILPYSPFGLGRADRKCCYATGPSTETS